MFRIHHVDLHRLEPKHYRWYQEIVAGGSLLLYRPGQSALHKGPDGLSRNVEGRDKLIMAKSSEWVDLRKRVRGICSTIHAGVADHEDQEALTVEQLERDGIGGLLQVPGKTMLPSHRTYVRTAPIASPAPVMWR